MTTNSQDKIDNGRKIWQADDEVETRLVEHFEKYDVSHNDVWKNFPIYTRRTTLKRFLAHYELFQKTVHLPGDIVELGVFKGASLMSWANFMEIRNMGDRHKKVVGFDNFKGFGELDEKDGAACADAQKQIGGFDSSSFEEPLIDAIDIFDQDRFIPYKKRVHLVKGDIEQTVPQYVNENPGMRISLLHFDVDLYRPTLTALESLWPLVVPGGVVAFDEYGIPPWEGEAKAVDEFFAGQNIELKRFDWCSNPGAYLIKKITHCRVIDEP
ncbi:TylF/MycF/NovP-related O-methyltransferase [Thalassotalea euphylliae]|uniref:Macrocin-O-methyltransferase n=1 Tax=Thalassotalea euphylliae TaxID=1655234 RepID=A0A3E0UGF7_9GAMM|nr:TylF/MycF/NovP-related O-methyltransferase [Thalassotalea euphylliae]REL34832.1 macrocin-O-methyltransferase [Thalassotalea euphylliae]